MLIVPEGPLFVKEIARHTGSGNALSEDADDANESSSTPVTRWSTGAGQRVAYSSTAHANP